MPIDPLTESLITLGEAARTVPPNGVSAATMSRWIQRGVRGVKLQTIVIGGRRLTSREALTRFFEAQNASEPVAPEVTTNQRRRQAEVADRLLKDAGI